MTKNNKFLFLGIVASFVFIMAFVLAPTGAEAYTQITGNTTLRVGSSGQNVISLQELLASDVDVYPSGTKDGKFGPLTRNGVIQFQVAYKLTPDGIVGPITRNKINSIVTAGRGIDIAAPVIYSLVVSSSGRNQNLSFNTTEPVKAAVFYDVNALNWNGWDDTEMSLNTPNISGVSSVDSSFGNNKQFTLSNLSANTSYNYIVTATDQSGNTSVIWPSRFTSGQ